MQEKTINDEYLRPWIIYTEMTFYNNLERELE